MRRATIAAAAAALLAAFAISASACTFYFNYESIAAPIGTVGEVGIRVQKTHAKCTLSSMDEYVIDGEGIQILGETAWEDLGGQLYEKWVQVSLAQEGDGFLRISKDCTKEGYEEKVLPIAALPPEDDALWTTAWEGEYPFEAPESVESVLGVATVVEEELTVADQTLTLPEGAVLPEVLPETVRVFFQQEDGRPITLLLVGEGLFLRFDHLRG